MSKNIKIAILVASAGVLVFAFAGGLTAVRASNDSSYRQMEVYSEVLSRVRSEYVEEPNLPTVTDGALHGLRLGLLHGRLGAKEKEAVSA